MERLNRLGRVANKFYTIEKATTSDCIDRHEDIYKNSVGKKVSIINLTIGKSVVLSFLEDEKSLRTSPLVSVDITEVFGSLQRLKIETRNTIYYLDELDLRSMTNIKGDN